MSRVGFVLLLLLGFAVSASAQGDPPPKEQPQVLEWVSPDLPRGMKLDPKKPKTILRLKSGEWVQGELQRIEDGDVELDGDDSADKTYDIEKVVELHSLEPFLLKFEDGQTLRVRRWSITEDGWLVVQSEDGKVSRHLRVFLARAYGLYGESDVFLKRWRGSITLSISQTFGNTRNGSALGVATLVRQLGDWRFTVEGELSQGRSDSKENEKSRRGKFQVDYDLNLSIYLTIGYAEAFYDRFQNIELRARGGSGLGYRLLRQTNLHWVVETTGIATHVIYRRVEAGNDRRDTSAALRLATRFWAEFLNDDVKIDILYETFLDLGDIKDTTHHARATFSYELVKDFTIDFTVIYDRNESPEQRDDGTRPKRDDLNLSIGLGWKL